jgi:hypothetical protein
MDVGWKTEWTCVIELLIWIHYVDVNDALSHYLYICVYICLLILLASLLYELQIQGYNCVEPSLTRSRSLDSYSANPTICNSITFVW